MGLLAPALRLPADAATADATLLSDLTPDRDEDAAALAAERLAHEAGSLARMAAAVGLRRRDAARQRARPATWDDAGPRESQAHTLRFILSDMHAIRRTISLPPAVAARLDREARRRGTSFSALVTELVERHPAPLPYAATVDDDPDLSLKVEEVLARLGR